MFEVVLDTETTGLSVSDGHRIVEIGCIELKDLIPTKNRFHCYLNPQRKVSEQAFKVHGYTDEFLSKQKKFNEIVDDFLKFIYGKRLVIHNAEFDLSHLNNELSLLGKNKIKEDIVDTLQIARDKFPGSGTSLDALCKRYNIDNSRRAKHNAVIDCELLSKVYINLLDQKEPRFNLNVEKDLNEKTINNSKVKYSNKIVKPTDKELKMHNEFLKREIKKNYFN
tara:strand:+ start:2300 stop:2968 length:669 start_codon:yes stop_codon:yes gene_type:complete